MRQKSKRTPEYENGIARAKELVAQGMSISAAAREVGLKENTVHRRLRDDAKKSNVTTNVTTVEPKTRGPAKPKKNSNVFMFVGSPEDLLEISRRL